MVQRKSKVTWILVAFTAAYAVAFYFLAIQTKACNPDEVLISPNWFHGFWDKFLACRQINELGDTLGGAFAPIAFLWLAGTVFIQSQELAAQRQELDETQFVMREQLEVARQQVEETRASTVLFQKQTQILEREQAQREENQADEEFDQMLENFKIVLGRAGEIRALITGFVPAAGAIGEAGGLSIYESEKDVLIFDVDYRELERYDLATLVSSMIRSIDEVLATGRSEGGEIAISPAHLLKIERHQDSIREMLNSSSGISKKHFLKLDGLGLNYLSMLFRELRSVAQPHVMPD